LQRAARGIEDPALPTQRAPLRSRPAARDAKKKEYAK
jgi:hypothetical protein